jgi:hypothetical protein
MIKLGCGLVSLLCLLVAAFVLWQTPGFPEKLPTDLADWVVAWFKLFRNPVAALALFGLCVAFAVASASVTELLLGIVFSLTTAVLSVFCLVGALGATSKPFAQFVENFFR